MGQSLKSSISLIAGQKAAVIFIGLFFTPVLVRLLGPSEYGRYATILSIFAFANILMTSGTNDAVRKFISEKPSQDWQNGVFGYIARPAAVLAIAVAIAFIIGAYSGLVEQTLGPEYVVPFYLLAFFALGRQFHEYLLRTLLGLQLENWSEPIKVLKKISFASMGLTAAYLGYSVEGLLIADFLTSLLIGSIVLIVISRHLHLRALIKPPKIDLTLSEAGNYVAGTVVFFTFLMSLYHIDILFLRYFETEETVGYYKAALEIAQVLWFAPMAVQLALLQRVSDLWAAEEIDLIQKQAETVTHYVVMFTLLVSIGMAALASDFVPLYLGSDFEPAVVPLVLLLPGVVGFATARPLIAINQGRRSLRPLIIATGGCATVNLCLNITLIPRYGMVGAAIATSIGYGSLALFQTGTAHYIGYNPFRGVPFLRIAITGLVAAIPIFGVASMINSAMISLLIVPPIGFIVFTTTAVLTGAVELNEIQPITSHIQKILI